MIADGKYVSDTEAYTKQMEKYENAVGGPHLYIKPGRDMGRSVDERSQL